MTGMLSNKWHCLVELQSKQRREKRGEKGEKDIFKRIISIYQLKPSYFCIWGMHIHTGCKGVKPS